MLSQLFKDAPFSYSLPPNLRTFISLEEVYRFGQCLGKSFSPISTLLSLVSFRAFGGAPHSRFRCGNPNQCLPNFSKMLLFALPKMYTGVFYLWNSIDLDSAWIRDSKSLSTFFSGQIWPFLKSTEVYFPCGNVSICTVFGLEILAHINFLFSRKVSLVYRSATLAFQVRESQPILTQLFKDATFSPLSNLHTCISLLEVYRFGQCLGKRFSSLLTFFSGVTSRAFRDALHSSFRCGVPQQCLPNFLKMLLLALPQIYTRVFHLWKTIDLYSAWVRDSRPYQFCFLQ